MIQSIRRGGDKQRALAWVPEPMRCAPVPEPITLDQHNELPPWEEEPDSAKPERGSDAKPESGGYVSGTDGSEPFEVEEAA